MSVEVDAGAQPGQAEQRNRHRHSDADANRRRGVGSPVMGSSARLVRHHDLGRPRPPTSARDEHLIAERGDVGREVLPGERLGRRGDERRLATAGERGEGRAPGSR